MREAITLACVAILTGCALRTGSLRNRAANSGIPCLTKDIEVFERNGWEASQYLARCRNTGKVYVCGARSTQCAEVDASAWEKRRAG